MNTKTFNWAIIGTGRIATVVAKEIVKTGRHKIVSVYSRTKSKADKFAKRFDAICYDSIQDAVLDKNVDAVYIATPHSSHYKIMRECIALKKPILCEKAFTVNAEQAKVVLEEALSNDVYICEGMWSRFNPVIKQIDEWIKNDEIGEIKSINANFCLPLTFTKPFISDRVYKKEYAGGALLDLGVYPVAYAHLFLGNPQKIECTAKLVDGVDYDDNILLHYKNAICNLNCSFEKLLTYVGTIEGSKGKIVSPMFYKPSRATLINGKGKTSVKCKSGYIYQFDGVAEDIRQNKLQNRLISHKDTLEIMTILDTCRKQNNFKYPNNIESL